MGRRHECSPPTSAPVGALWTCSKCWGLRRRDRVNVTGPAPAGKWSAEGWTPVRVEAGYLHQYQLKALRSLVRWGQMTSASIRSSPNTMEGLVARAWVRVTERGALLPEYAITDAGQLALAGHRARGVR